MDQQNPKTNFKKIDFLHCRISYETKKRLKQKARNARLGLTEYIEKVANEEVIFIDENVKRLFNVIRFVPKI